MTRIAFVLVVAAAITQNADAAPPSASVLPAGTKFHVSIPDMAKLEANWGKTKLGTFWEDAKIKKFLEDLALDVYRDRLLVIWRDLSAAAAGEVSLSAVAYGPGKFGYVMTVDVKGRKSATDKLLANAVTQWESMGYAKRKGKVVAGIPVSVLSREGKDSEKYVLHFVKDETLIITDQEELAVELMKRWGGKEPDRLEQVKAYQEVLKRAKARTKTPLDWQWFMDPLGLAEAAQAVVPGKAKRSSTLKTFKSEGFNAFQGVGGIASVGLPEQDLVHTTVVYAPGPYKKSMRMVQLVPGADFTPQDWVPGELTQCTTLCLDVREAFKYVGSLFDALYGDGDAGTFDDVLKGLRDDPNGPQVDVEKDLIAKLGKRITVISDTEKPVDIFSARSLIAIETTDEKSVARALRRLVENDEDVKQRRLQDGTIVWELIAKEKKTKKGAKPAPPAPKAPNAAIAVARGHLLLASNIKILERVLSGKETKPLAKTDDYQRMTKQLQALGAGKDSLRSFGRLDEDFQTVYEMLRSDRLEKATSSMYSQALLSLFGEYVTGLDARMFPDYDLLRPYLGNVGMYAVNEPDGWVYVGCLLRKR